MRLDSSLTIQRHLLTTCCTSKRNRNSKFGEENQMSSIGIVYRLAAEHCQYKNMSGLIINQWYLRTEKKTLSLRPSKWNQHDNVQY